MPDFDNLQDYRSTYRKGERVLFIPLFADCKEPVLGIVSADRNRMGDYTIRVSSGDVVTTPDRMRKATTATLRAWFDQLDATEDEDGEVLITTYETLKIKAA